MFRFGRWPVAVASLLIAALIAVVLVLSVGRSWLLGSDVAPGTPRPASATLSTDERAFYQFVAPRLRRLAAESRALDGLGHNKSRNLIELQRRSDSVQTLGTQIDTYAAQHRVPDRLAGWYKRYLTGVANVRRAMDESQAGFLRFDWDRVARAVTMMDQGVAELDAATAELERLAGAATPAV